MEDITQKCGDIHADWAKNFTAAFANTLLTTVKKQNDGTTFLLTGDIPAMWSSISIDFATAWQLPFRTCK